MQRIIRPREGCIVGEDKSDNLPAYIAEPFPDDSGKGLLIIRMQVKYVSGIRNDYWQMGVNRPAAYLA